MTRRENTKGDDATCIPYISGSSCSRLLSECHILSEIGRCCNGELLHF